MPFAYWRSVIKDAIGKVRSYLSNYARQPAYLVDMTWSDNALECGRNAGDAGLDQGGANDACPALFTDLGNG